jgi:gamma-glutamylcyclotransferase (GGCT)/AIG2-like uncharacterized protein YtfP
MKVFVYGTLLTGFGNNRLLNSSKLLGPEVIEGFDMYSLGGFPAISPGKGRVEGEVWEIEDKTLNVLDALEGYPHFYNRMKINISNNTDEAWVYFMDDPGRFYNNSAPVVASGSWKTHKFPIPPE